MAIGPTPESPRDATLRRIGTRAWLLVGIVLAAAIAYTALAAVSGLVVPLVVAAVVGVLFVPVTDRLATRVPRPAATLLVIVGLVATAVVLVLVTVEGIVDQSQEIGRQVSAGWDALERALVDVGFDPAGLASLEGGAGDLASGALGGMASYLGTALTSVTAFVAGVLVAAFLLYFVLADWPELSAWVGAHLGLPPEVGAGIVEDGTFLLRQYFVALTVSSVVTAAVIGLAAAVLGVPLALTIAVVTFATSYVPYLGAIVAGAFAALIALGSSGPADALVLLGVILVAQNVVQTIVQTKLTQDRLDLHPIVIFGSTIVGAALAGVLGATLSAPVVALLVRIGERLGAARRDDARAAVHA